MIDGGSRGRRWNLSVIQNCYRVTIGDPIGSGPGQEWDKEWALTQTSLKGHTDHCRAPTQSAAQQFQQRTAMLSPSPREKYADALNKQTCDLDSQNLFHGPLPQMDDIVVSQNYICLHLSSKRHCRFKTCIPVTLKHCITALIFAGCSVVSFPDPLATFKSPDQLFSRPNGRRTEILPEAQQTWAIVKSILSTARLIFLTV